LRWQKQNRSRKIANRIIALREKHGVEAVADAIRNAEARLGAIVTTAGAATNARKDHRKSILKSSFPTASISITRLTLSLAA
jgi:hypothetical protein